MTIFDVFVFISGIILIAIGSFLLYSFLIKHYKQNAVTFRGIFFLGPIPILFNNDNQGINLLSIIFSISLIIAIFFVLFSFIFLNYINSQK
jgi:uncharacterized membrane protein